MEHLLKLSQRDGSKSTKIVRTRLKLQRTSGASENTIKQNSTDNIVPVPQNNMFKIDVSVTELIEENQEVPEHVYAADRLSFKTFDGCMKTEHCSVYTPSFQTMTTDHGDMEGEDFEVYISPILTDTTENTHWE